MLQIKSKVSYRDSTEYGWTRDPTATAPLLFDELKHRYTLRNRYVEVDFRRLIHWVRLGDQHTHQIHPYPAKLLPSIANFFVYGATLAGGRVLDPFCGSGTVALEASLAGHTAYVADANPLALLITKVKTTPYDPEELCALLGEVVRRAARFKTAPEVSIVNEHLWYSQSCKKALEILLRAIMEVEGDAERDFFRVCLSVTARRLSYADPAISVPVRLRRKKRLTKCVRSRVQQRLRWIARADPVEEFVRTTKSNIERVVWSNMARRDRQVAVEVGTDARQLRLPRERVKSPVKVSAHTVPLVVTSPPYGSAQKYIRASSLSLNWLGIAGPNELSQLEGRSIGREHVPRHREVEPTASLPRSYERLLKRIWKIDETRGRITWHYLAELSGALREMARVTSPGGRVVIVIGNNQVCGKPLRNDKFVERVCQQLDLKLELGLVDDIKSRGLMTKRNKTASVITRESVLVFRK